MAKQTTITEAIISLIQAMEDVVRQFGDRLERGPEPGARTTASALPRRGQRRGRPARATGPRRHASQADSATGATGAAKSKKLRSALKSYWANMTPEQRAERVAKMRAGRQKTKAAGRMRRARRPEGEVAPSSGFEVGNG